MVFRAVWDRQDRCSHDDDFWVESNDLIQIMKENDDDKPIKKPIKHIPRTRGKPFSPEFQALHNIARRIRPMIRASLLSGIEAFKGKIDLRELAEALDEGNSQKAFSVVPWQDFDGSFPDIDDAIQAGVTESAVKSKFLYKRAIKQLLGVSPDVRFDTTNDAIRLWVENHTGELIQNIKASTQEAIQNIIRESIDNGVPSRTAAKQIKPLVGLNNRQARAVMNRRNALMKQGFKGPKLESLINDYIERSIVYRSEMIARTEAMFVNNQGLYEVARQNLDDGFIDGKKAKKKWIVTPYDRVCKICRPMQGATTGINEQFFLPVTGTHIDHPPAHPNCNCSWAIVFED